jgi:predicted ATPase/GAF domain-containing protein/HPt (histidine-containing phosphotransfer) domain-containing protein
MPVRDYELREIIATSERSVVRRAVRVRDGTPVVIKTIAHEYPTPRELRQLEFEYRILRKLEVAGVIRALAFERNGNQAALVLEDFGGKNLASGPDGLELYGFFSIAIQAAQALGRIHERNVVHKDIKPRNLLVNPDTQELRIIDFHVASELSRELQDSAAPGQVEGSLAYMSPEQTGRMNRELDYRSDYYSLGVTLFELLTGALPFQANDTMAWVHCHISRRAPLVSRIKPDVPAMVAEIIAKLMAKDPDERYQSSHGLIADLTLCQEQWESAGAIEPFALAQQDISEKFQVSQKLFGREQELRVLLDVFDEAIDGPAKLLLVSGESGVGKSSLIHEIQGSIVRRKGYFAFGKFEPLDREVPYAALVDALRKLVRQLLSESDRRLAEWKSKLAQALATSGHLLFDLIPELEQVVGPKVVRGDLDATESRHRVLVGIRELIKVFAQRQHPLVIALDDLQWMDISTQDVLAELLGGDEIRHLLLIGTYRDNEVDPESALGSCLESIRAARPNAVRDLPLRSLPVAAVNQLVAETLHASEEATAPLARIVFEKTEGNPFFTSELLGCLYRDGAFAFETASGKWQWDIGKVSEATVSENVAELMIDRLRRISGDTADVLKLAACFGKSFDFQNLRRISDRSATEIAGALWESIHQRIIVPLDGNYRLLHPEHSETSREDLCISFRFQHDRVQQAAYSLIGQSERPRVHLEIGRLLAAAARGFEREERVFELVNHLNLGHRLMTEPAELKGLAELNLRAARTARGTGAYAIALVYFERALELANNALLASEPPAKFELLQERAECVFMAGELERALELCDELLQLAGNKFETGAAYYLKVRVIEHQGRLVDAIAASRTALRAFGVELPEDPAEIERRTGEGIAKMQAHLAKMPVEELVNLPRLTDREKAVTLELLFEVIAPAIQTYPPLFVLAELMMFDLALTHGTTAVSSKNFVDCGIIQGGILGNYDVAYRLGQAAFKLLERYPSAALEAAAHFVFAAFVSHWRRPFREGFESLARCQKLGLESGNHHHVAYAYVSRGLRMLYTGYNLQECEAENAAGFAFLTRERAVGPLAGTLVWRRMVARLTGRDGDAAATERADDAAFESLKQTKNAQWLYSFGQSRMITSFLFGEIDAAAQWQRFTEPYLKAANGLFSLPDYHLFHALILTRNWSARDEAERVQALEIIEQVERKLRVWAENCPENFAHKHDLLSAELARVRELPFEEVLARYEQAIAAAGDAFLHLRALAHKLQAEYCAERGHAKIARMLLREAYQMYAQWGADALLKALERRNPELAGSIDRAQGSSPHAGSSSTVKGGAVLDAASVLKATQAISSEVRTDKLFAALMNAIIENAGAQRGCLILKNDSDQGLYVEASANVDPAAPEISRSVPLESASEVCADIVRYATRTHETIVLDDAAERSPFQSDPYIRQHCVKSLLCMPLLNQGELIGVLYAENNSASCAFTKERLGILRVVASQAAISIKNAQLYDSLEEKVQVRTLELAQKNREIAAMLDGMEQGVFTIDEELTIQPEYSKHLERILGTTSIAGQPCIPMLFRGAELGADLVNSMEAALRFSFDAPAGVAEANFAHLVKEFERRDDNGATHAFEVDWNMILDARDRVSKILIAVRDVTVLRQLRETASAKARELDIVGQILDAGVESFHGFCESTHALLEENRDLIARKAAELTRAEIQALFRNVHSIKGNARLLGFNHLVDVVHAVESAYAELRGEPRAAIDVSELQAGLDAVKAAVSEYEQVCSRKLNPLSLSQDARLERTLREIERLVSSCDDRAPAAQILPRVSDAISRLRAVPLLELVKETSRMFPSLAGELDKSVPQVQCCDQGTVLNREWAEVMRNVFVHSFRNSLAHGIESPAERQQAGKEPHGTIRLVTERSDGKVRVRLSDDGKGLPLDALRERIGRSNGDEELADAVFASGISTSASVSQLSGRGVGMDVVRSSVRTKGGDVGIVFTGETRAGHRPFELVVTLPSDAVVAVAALDAAG